MTMKVGMDTSIAGTAERNEESLGRPSAQDEDRFKSLYKQDNEAGGSSSDDSGDSGEEQSASSLSSLMSGLLNGRPAASDAVVPTAPAAGAADPGELVETLVSRILVSDPAHSNQPEVRLLLQNSVLSDTEISLTRSQDGLLTVQIFSGEESSRQTLVAARQRLQERLEAHENGAVRIVIEKNEPRDTSDGRSRGLVDSQGIDDE
ncbi:hypothetical protein C4J81_17745 [Deltaproteobacteria bacterium Smac51]|nr:hypothetical protein C4J81_17745 [Deltaproteobacteria bacterium Smac51]